MIAKAVHLTPVERGVLLLLAFANRPLKENAEIRGEHKLSFTAAHRKKLLGLSLARQTTDRPSTLEITDEGWAWAETELSAPFPSGQMGLGAFYGVLKGLGEALSRRSTSLRDFLRTEEPAQGSTVDYASRLADAAWAAAEEDIARAIQDMGTPRRNLDRLARIIATAEAEKRDKALQQVERALELVFQHVWQAARRRDLAQLHERGDTIEFDAASYESDLPLDQGETASVVKPAVTITRAGQTAILLRGLVDPC